MQLLRYQDLPLSQQKSIFFQISSWTVDESINQERYKHAEFKSIYLYRGEKSWRVFDHAPESHDYFFQDRKSWDLADWVLELGSRGLMNIEHGVIKTLGDAFRFINKIVGGVIERYSKWRDTKINEDFHIGWSADTWQFKKKGFTGPELTLIAGSDSNRRAKGLSETKNAESECLWVRRTSLKSNVKREKSGVLGYRVQSGIHLDEKRQFEILKNGIIKNKIKKVFFLDLYSFFSCDEDSFAGYRKMMALLNEIREMGVSVFGIVECTRNWHDHFSMRYVKGSGLGLKMWGKIILARKKYWLQKELETQEETKQKQQPKNPIYTSKELVNNKNKTSKVNITSKRITYKRNTGIVMGKVTKMSSADTNIVKSIYEGQRRKIFADASKQVSDVMATGGADIQDRIRVIHEDRDMAVFNLAKKLEIEGEMTEPVIRERLSGALKAANDSMHPDVFRWYRIAVEFTSNGKKWGDLRAHVFALLMHEIEVAGKLPEIDYLRDISGPIHRVANYCEPFPSLFEIKLFVGKVLKNVGVPGYIGRVKREHAEALDKIEAVLKK